MNPFIQYDDQIQLILENIPSIHDEWVKNDATTIQETIRHILHTYPEDYFVTPSHASLFPRRLCMSGQYLLNDSELFTSFVERSYKATPRTQ